MRRMLRDRLVSLLRYAEEDFTQVINRALGPVLA